MAESKTARFQFGLAGLVTKENPALLGDGQYRSMRNMEIVQEGGLATIAGRRLLGSVGTGVLAYMIRKLTVDANTEIPSIPSFNPRYVGVAAGSNDLYRTTDFAGFTKVASAVNSIAGRSTKRFGLAPYSVGNTGDPWAFIAAENMMLKDRGSSPYTTVQNSNGGILPRWGILPAFGVATATAGAAGFLDGGASGSPGGSTAYDYRYVNLGNDTNNRGNPSGVMLSDSAVANGTPCAVNLKKITVVGYGTNDPQVLKIEIYRRGGILFDAWRRVGLVNNPGLGSAWTFSDNVPDIDLEFAPLLETDNDPPVTSTCPVPITGRSGGIVVTGRQSVTFAQIGVSTMSRVTPGTVAHFFYDNPEDVILEEVLPNVAGGVVTAYFQHTHAPAADWEIDAITGQPCFLAIPHAQFVIVAGDPNNPHLLYRCKGDMPESFANSPADGSIATTACGTPSNPIMGLADFRGQILTLNKNSLFETAIFNGSFLTASEACKKGVVGVAAWCQTDSEIWFRTTDGVWSWDGGTARKRSEAIDPIFHGEQINGLPPAAVDPANIADTVLEYRRGHVEVLYWGIDGRRYRLVCEPLFGDRWRLVDAANPASGFIFTDPDTGVMVEARDFPGVGFSLDDQVVVSAGNNYTSDDFINDPTSQGNPIQFELFLPWFELGNSQVMKLLEEAYLDLSASLQTGSASMSIDILLDYSDVPVDTITVPLTSVSVTSGRTLLSLLPDVVRRVGGNLYSFGREARAFSYRIYGAAYPARMSLFSLTFRYTETGVMTAGACTDWMNLGSLQDKRLYQMRVEFDVSGIDQVLFMDAIQGREGNAYNPNVASFVLSNPEIDGSGRASKVFPCPDQLIVKEVRLRAAVGGPSTPIGPASSNFFRILDVSFEKEEYPPDVVAFTPWDDGGYEYDKYANQIDLSVNTNGVAVTVQVWADGAPTSFNFQVTSTEGDRRRNITCPPKLRGKLWRLYVNPSQPAIATGAGMFQLFYAKGIFKFQKADPGEVVHTADWDDLGHPYDKYLKVVTIEWDLSDAPPASTVTVQLDTINGINGQTVNSNVMQMVLSGGRGKRTFPIAADVIAKLIQLYPVTTPSTAFKQWKYVFDKIDYPPDIVSSTEWRDAENPNDKNPSWVWVDADTNGIAATVILQNELGTVITFQHTGTVTNRKKDYPIPADQIGKMWRLLAAIGTGGKFQLFQWGFARWQPTDQASGSDPCDVVLWTPWNDFGWPYDKDVRNLILTVDTGGVTVPVNLEAQPLGVTVETLSVTGTYTNRRVIIPCSSSMAADQSAIQYRLVVPTPLPSNAIFKLWDWSAEIIKEPAAVNSWDSLEQTFGWKFWKYMKQFWLMYKSAGTVTLVITSDTGTFSITLPAHARRLIERFPLPVEFGAGKNKSKTYRLNLSNASIPFKFYAEGSGVEWIAIGQDRHAAYQQMSLSEMMTLGEGQ